MDLREKVKSYLHDTGCTVTNFCKKIGISTVYYYDVGVKSPYSTLKILHKHTIFLPL